MSVYLTQLAADNFTRANVSPLAAPWALDNEDDSGLQVLNDVCVATVQNSANGMIYNYSPSTPSDQYCSVTVNSTNESSNCTIAPIIRWTDSGSPIYLAHAYQVQLQYGSPNLYWTLLAAGSDLAAGTDTSFTPGDIWTVAAIGTTIYVLKNGVVIHSLTNTTYSAGTTGLLLQPFHLPNTNPAVPLFAMGSASLTSPVTNSWCANHRVFVNLRGA